MKKTSRNKGFTLIEILVVIGIIAVLAAIVIVAINPARQFAQARDTQRTSNLNSILNAIGQRIADNRGTFEGTMAGGAECSKIPSATTTILTTTGPEEGKIGCLVPTYISALPIDPSMPAGSTDTGYKFFQDGNGRVHVIASTTEPSIPRNTIIEIVR